MKRLLAAWRTDAAPEMLLGMTFVADRRVAFALAVVAVALAAAAPGGGALRHRHRSADRVDPAAGTTRVAYRLIPRRDRSSPAQATILFNPGGPGQAPIGLAALVRRELAPCLSTATCCSSTRAAQVAPTR